MGVNCGFRSKRCPRARFSISKGERRPGRCPAASLVARRWGDVADVQATFTVSIRWLSGPIVFTSGGAPLRAPDVRVDLVDLSEQRRRRPVEGRRVHGEPHVAPDELGRPGAPDGRARLAGERAAGQVPSRGRDEGDPVGELDDVALLDRVAVLRFVVDPREDDAHQHGEREDEQRRPDRPPVDPSNAALVAVSLSSVAVCVSMTTPLC